MSQKSEDEQFQNNPFAICSAKIDRKKEPAKWERCVKDVKKEKGMSDNISEAFTEDFPGGGYLAEHDDDGEFWTIRDVPFFSELPAGTRNNETAISHEWMQAVISRHQELERDQKHLPAVHANHHDSGRDNFRIGFLRPTRVGKLVLDGKPRWTLFGDIVRIEGHHYEQIKDLRYPYRSAEIGRGWKPEIASLALSEDEAPHFKLPMLTIGEERRPFESEFSSAYHPAMAFSEVGDSTYICFSFRGTTMPKKESTEKLAEHPNDNDKDKETDEIGKRMAQMISDSQHQIPAMVEAIVKKVLENMIPPKVNPDEEGRSVDPPMFKEKTEETKKAEERGKELVEAMGELKGEIAALKEQERQRALAAESKELAEENIKSLRSDGWHLSEEVEKSIRDIAGESKSALEKFIEGYKATMPKDPPKTLEEVEVFATDPPDLVKYKTQSPQVLEAARSLSRQYDELKDGGGRLTTTREEFIDINLETMSA